MTSAMHAISTYIGYTRRHLYQRIAEQQSSAVIENYVRKEHNMEPSNLKDNFVILKKCRSKFDCLVYEPLYTRDVNSAQYFFTLIVCVIEFE